MALTGVPRDETAAISPRTSSSITREALLDEVYARVGG
jgi:hypothetical protein